MIQQMPENVVANPEEKLFIRLIKVLPKTKLKGVRKAILEELGVQDMCTARLYSVKGASDADGEAGASEDVALDGSAEKDKAAGASALANLVDGEELVGEMASLETLGIANGSKLEVEVYFTIEVLVPGKGAGYNQKIEVGPEEVLGVIEDRVSFFRIFKMRGFEVYAPEIDRIFDNADMNSLHFRDSQLKNGSKLVLCEPSKNRDSENEGEASDADADADAEGGEDEMMEEGGEDEQDEMNEENEEEGEGEGDDDDE